MTSEEAYEYYNQARVQYEGEISAKNACEQEIYELQQAMKATLDDLNAAEIEMRNKQAAAENIAKTDVQSGLNAGLKSVRTTFDETDSFMKELVITDDGKGMDFSRMMQDDAGAKSSRQIEHIFTSLRQTKRIINEQLTELQKRVEKLRGINDEQALRIWHLEEESAYHQSVIRQKEDDMELYLALYRRLAAEEDEQRRLELAAEEAAEEEAAAEA